MSYSSIPSVTRVMKSLIIIDCVPATQVLVDPEPTKWQPVPSDAPIAVQVAVLVVLPSVQTVAVYGKENQFSLLYVGVYVNRDTVETPKHSPCPILA